MAAISSLPETEQDSTHGNDQSASLKSGARTRVYLMDLWSFIPYYMARLYRALCEKGIGAKLGVVRYHLQRNYFRQADVSPDAWLLDFGGELRNPLLRRIVKSIEYLINISLLAFRILISPPAVIHVEYLPFIDHGFAFEIWFMKWAQHLGIPVVYTVHNVTYQDAPERHKPLYGRAYRTADALICHDEQARAQLIGDFGITPAKIWLIPHGPLFEDGKSISPAEARARLGLATKEPLVLCFGVISEYKGIPFLLDAWKRVIKEGLAGRLLVAGTGDPHLLSSIRDKVSKGGLEASVTLHLDFIPVEQLPLFYQAADILVFPYSAGTTSGALLTGLNYGKAIVATKLAFFREHLTEGEDALFVEYGDIDGMSLALASLLEDPKMRERFGRSVAERSTRLTSWSNIARLTIHCYECVKRCRSAES